MKRSFINREIAAGIAFLEEMRIKLPPFAYWTPGEWETKGEAYKEIRDCMLGWDITDFGTGDFEKTGLLVITIRNGIKDSEEYVKTYAEKCLIVKENQVTPMHYHYHKMEDIINRGGGNLMVKLYESTSDEALSESPLRVKIDGYFREFEAGAVIRLLPGSSVTMHRRLYHSFWAEEGCGTVVVGEVSTVNDDKRDNRFLPERGRFPAIEEDEPPIALLVSDY